MPTYEYACRACGEHLDVVQAYTDDPLEICPKCGGELRKVFGAIGIVLKGSGFYKNDSRTNRTTAKSGSKESSSGDSASPNGSGDGSATDSKSDSSAQESTSKDPPVSIKSAETNSSTPKAAAAS